jgi:hypothetical protein
VYGVPTTFTPTEGKIMKNRKIKSLGSRIDGLGKAMEKSTGDKWLRKANQQNDAYKRRFEAKGLGDVTKYGCKRPR